MQNALVMIVLTFMSWIYCQHHVSSKGTYPISILQNVPKGFQDEGTFHIDPVLMSALGSELFVTTIILLLKHISITKSFGHVNSYKINLAQELVTIGITNTIGILFHPYPTMGPFSHSALKSKSGMHTLLAELSTGLHHLHRASHSGVSVHLSSSSSS